MLLEFSVENYLSIKDKQTFTMYASAIKEFPENTFKTDLLGKSSNGILKSTTIYGANASGKSNLLFALYTLKSLVENSHKNQINDQLNIVPFKLDDETPHLPSFFEIKFIKNKVLFLYQIRLDKHKVHDEALYYWENSAKKNLFKRYNTNKFKFNFSKNRNQKKTYLEEIYLEQTLDNILFLSQATKLKNKIATEAFQWFSENLHVFPSDDFNPSYTFERIINNPSFRSKFFSYYISAAELDIQGIKFSERDFEKPPFMDDFASLLQKHIQSPNIERIFDFPEKLRKANTVHEYINSANEIKKVDFDLRLESAGTMKYISLVGPIDDVLENGSTLVIDELDIQLHPLLSKVIIQLFNKPTNSKNAQLIFSSHNTNLLDQDIFRRDQIWFAEKDKVTKSSEFYSLSDFKDVRNDLRLEKNYLLGRFGGIPSLEGWG